MILGDAVSGRHRPDRGVVVVGTGISGKVGKPGGQPLL